LETSCYDQSSKDPFVDSGCGCRFGCDHGSWALFLWLLCGPRL